MILTRIISNIHVHNSQKEQIAVEKLHCLIMFTVLAFSIFSFHKKNHSSKLLVENFNQKKFFFMGLNIALLEW